MKIPIRFNNHTWHMPTVRTDLTEREYMRIARHLQADCTAYTRAAVMTLLSDRKTRKYLNKCDGGVLVEISDRLKGLWEQTPVQALQNPAPLQRYFRVRRRRYWMPEPGYSDLTVHEYLWLQREYADFLEEQTEEQMYRVAAVILRPRRPIWQREGLMYDGYPRQRFNPELIEQRAHRLRSLPQLSIYVVFDYITRCEQMMRQRFAPVYEGAGSSLDGAPNMGWQGMVYSIAEAGTFGPESDVKGLNLHTFMLYSAKRVLEQRAVKREQDRIKRQSKHRYR